MFGNKAAKRERLGRIVDAIEHHPNITQGQLARKLKIPRATVHRDLPTLEALGILLSEDDRGRLSLFRKR